MADIETVSIKRVRKSKSIKDPNAPKKERSERQKAAFEKARAALAIKRNNKKLEQAAMVKVEA